LSRCSFRKKRIVIQAQLESGNFMRKESNLNLGRTPANEFHELFYQGAEQKRYVYGINEFADFVAKSADIDGYIDDFTADTTWQGKPIVRLSDVEDDALVVSCVTCARPIHALGRLREAGVKSFIDYYSLADISDGDLPQLPQITDSRVDYRENAIHYDWVRKRLIDGTSRETFDRILEFRLQADLNFMVGFEFAPNRQYFESFLHLAPGEVFVDGGGFDGITSLEFASRCPQYSAIHFFEPTLDTLAVARKKLSQLRNVNFYSFGLHESPGTLRFDSNSGPSSGISEFGDDYIEVVRLDDVIHEPVSFVKLDLEGAEIPALKGMTSRIMEDHPKLAVAVYHYPTDFWRIPQFVLGLRDDYDVYLRHYTEGWAETVMFFVPR
jgi:FkbM family methyltransferase